MAGGATVGVACSIGGDLGTSSSAPLIMWSTTQLWDGGVVAPVCFVSGTPQEWDVVRNAVENSWGNVANVHFSGWKACNMNDTNPVWVTVGIGTSPGGNAGVGPNGDGHQNIYGHWGASALSAPASFSDAGSWWTSVWIGYGGDRADFEATAVHEFGHVLGFEHEQDRDGGFTDPNFAPLNQYCSPAWVSDDAGNPVYDDAGNLVYDFADFPDRLLTPYDPDSIMNYCHALREDTGRLSDLDIQGVQSIYGPSTRVNGLGEVDSDGDGWADYRDNCPYTKNDQKDSNFDAELTLARGDPNWATDDGHRPTAAEKNNATYVNHWHDKYKGDACDPVASTSIDTSTYQSVGRTWCCTVRYVGGATWHYEDCGQQCPMTLYTGLTYASYIGGPAGFSKTASTFSAPAFCACDKIYDPDPNVRALCNSTIGTYQCDYAQDGLFPPLNNNPPPGHWNKLTEEISGFPFDTINTGSSMSHVNPEKWAAPPVYSSNWDLIADLPTYGKQLPPAHDPLLGFLWAHVNGTYPYTIINRPSPANLQNSYTLVDGDWQEGSIIHWVPPFGRKWWRIPYCNPLNPAQHLKYGEIGYAVSGNNNGDPYAIAQDDHGIYEFTSRITGSGIELLNAVSSDTAEVLVADDRVGGWTTDAINPNAIVVATGTTTIMGAFTINGTSMGAQATSIPTQTTTELRSYAAGDGKLYSLENIRGWKLRSLDVPLALAGQASGTLAAVSGAYPSNPRAVVWNAVTSRLIVLDWLTTAERLLSIDANGVSTELWRTQTFSATLPSTGLSATLLGEVVLSQWGLGDNLTHVLLMDTNGRPEVSTTVAGNVQSPVVANASGITAPVTQTVGDTTPNVGLAYVARSALGLGVCGSAWFKAIANSGVGSGTLVDGMNCPDPIMNGGFESGTFLNWTATGQSETISTNAHSGVYSARLGATTPTTGDSTVKQSFVVPASGAVLSFWYSNVCPDSVYYDWFTATLLDTAGIPLATIVPKTCAASSAWTQATLNLSSWAGQTVTVVLTSHDDNYPGDPTYSYVDDVGLQ